MSKLRSKNKDRERIVTIKPTAYYKMLIHVLRFGNKILDPKNYREVMGMLIGHLEGDADQRRIRNVIIEDAVPVSHGGSIEVDFAPQDYVAFAAVDENFAEKNWFTVGWYHSHPGLGIFFSGTDINNQLGWQTPNPSAIGIVFDHTFLENPEDLGFRTFRLEDPSKGSRSDYYEVETIVQPPDNLQFYFKLMGLINNVHSKEPPILEINETPDPFGEINFPTQNEILSKKPEINLTNTLEVLQKGMENFLELSMKPLINFFNVWSQNIIKNIIDNNIVMRKDLIEMKENLSQGFGILQNDFKFTLTDKLNELGIYVDDKLEEFDKDREILTDMISQFKREFNNLIDKLFQDKIKETINKLLNDIEGFSEGITLIEQSITQNSENLEKHQNSLKNLSEELHSIENLTTEELGVTLEKKEGIFLEGINRINSNLVDITKQTSEFNADLENLLSNFKSSRDAVREKIKTLEKEKKDLSNDLKKLKT
ncbi:MAG: hypothetical protein EU532_04385 [Promethearchaeota archaeon]|nr:MAG: hypothetical protein EU532_04385 [Candidatus Lokiarchaeota archaeon]